MNRAERRKAGFKGVGTALLKRGVFIMLGVVVFQLVNLQWTVSSGGDRQQKEANLRLERALKENQSEHAKTQKFVRCLIGIVLLPLDERPEDPEQALSTCGEVPDGVDADDQTPATPQSSPDTARTLQPTTGEPPDSTPAEQPATPQPAPSEPKPTPLVSPLVQPLLDLIKGLGL